MDDYLNLFVEETSWYNDIVLGAILPDKWQLLLPHFLRGWLRNYIGINVLYFLSGTLWCLVIYYWKRNLYIPEDSIPSRQSVQQQIFVAMKAMPWFSALPTLSEYMIEHGWTRCFSRISDVGWLAYVFYLIIYLVLMEFGFYWAHRALHKKFLYKHLHRTHHMYNKANSLSPFAALAFYPLDGILQGMPHVIALFLTPMHLTSYITILFIDGIWSLNIHDCIHGKLWPVMGAGYHAIHHTTYAHNYGHFTVWMDWMFGTLHDPEEDDAKNKKM